VIASARSVLEPRLHSVSWPSWLEVKIIGTGFARPKRGHPHTVRHLAIVILLAKLGLASGVSEAGAQGRAGASGMRVDPGFERSIPRKVNRGDVVRIARSLGMVEVNSVSRTGRRWRVHGVDNRGRKMRIVLSSMTGEILRISR
jgi:hypothetical protein